MRIDSSSSSRKRAATTESRVALHLITAKALELLVRVIGINRNFADTLAYYKMPAKTFLEKLHPEYQGMGNADNIFLRPKKL